MMYFTVRMTLFLPNLKKVSFHRIDQENIYIYYIQKYENGILGEELEERKGFGRGYEATGRAGSEERDFRVRVGAVWLGMEGWGKV